MKNAENNKHKIKNKIKIHKMSITSSPTTSYIINYKKFRLNSTKFLERGSSISYEIPQNTSHFDSWKWNHVRFLNQMLKSPQNIFIQPFERLWKICSSTWGMLEKWMLWYLRFFEQKVLETWLDRDRIWNFSGQECFWMYCHRLFFFF